MMSKPVHEEWAPFLERYRQGEWRAPVFRDLVLHDAGKLRRERDGIAVLDIGCGGGFDNDPRLQREIASVAESYVGVEPDEEIELEEIFSEVHRSFFEDAELAEESIDLAFTVMVLEHIEHPELFWKKLHAVLRPGGVFWGFTMDSRHAFVYASSLFEKLHIKDAYLNLLHGKRGERRYENYGVFYRSNNPRQIEKQTAFFSDTLVLNFSRVGQLDFYFPRSLRWAGRAFDRFAIGLNLPGSLLAVRVVK